MDAVNGGPRAGPQRLCPEYRKLIPHLVGLDPSRGEAGGPFLIGIRAASPVHNGAAQKPAHCSGEASG